MEKPPRPFAPELEESYDDGDPYACMAAGAAGIRSKSPNYIHLLSQVCGDDDSPRVARWAQTAPDHVKAALYDMWDRGRSYRMFRRESQWAALQMAKLGEPSLLEYDRAVPPDPQ